MERLLITIAILLYSLRTLPQEFITKPLPTQHLLPSASIHCLFRDSEGYMWYGTERAGACRDNGYQVDIFSPSDVTAIAESDQITCIGETNDGNILLGTGTGLFQLDKKTYQLHPVEPQGEKIHSIMTDSKGQTWIGVEGRVRQLNGKETACTTDGQQRPVISLYENHNKTLFALEWQGGIMYRQDGEEQFTPLKTPQQVNPVAMLEDTDLGCYWVLTSNMGIVRLDIQGDTSTVRQQEATCGDGGRNRGLSLLQDSRHGLLWETTMDNLYAYRVADGQLQPFPLHSVVGEEKKVLDQLLESPNGEIYVAGFMPQTFIVAEDKEKVTRLTVDPIQELSGYPLHADRSMREEDELWIWHRRVGLILYNLKTNKLTLAPWKVNTWFQRCRSLKNGMWASRSSTLFHVWQDKGFPMRQEICQMPDSAEICCIHDNGTGTLFIATSCHIYRYSLTSRRLKTIATTTDAPTSITITNEMLCWIADGQVFSLNLSKGQNNESQSPVQLQGIERASDLASSDDGNVWIATQSGKTYCLQLMTGNLVEAEYMRSENGAPILDIAVDGMGHVWVLSDQQVREYNPHTQAFRTLSANAPRIGVSQFCSIEVEDANHLTINGAGALCMVESSAMLNQPSTIVKPHLSAYQIGKQKHYTLSEDGEIVINPDDVELTLFLTTFEQTAADKVSFAYQVDGISRDWLYNTTGDNIIHFTKLPVGTYSLLVKATDLNGCWGTPVQLATLRILPVWYQTWWARILFFVIIVSVCIGIWKLEKRIQLLHRLIRRRENVRLDEIEMKREDIMQKRLDDEFLSKAVQAVETHLADCEFNVESLADALCMSRANLHRRMKAQTAMSPTDFIRDIRLKKAAHLLLNQPEASITDIAKRVGFATPKYFSRLFREKFGVSPKEYAGEKTTSPPSTQSEEKDTNVAQ